MHALSSCKLCRSKSLNLIKRYQATTDLDPLWSDLYRLFSYLPYPLSIRLVVCRRCGFLFYQDTFTHTEMVALYEAEKRYTKDKSHQLKPGRLWELDGLVRFLKRNVPRPLPTNALDIGAGDFVAFDRITALWPEISFEAVDPSYPQAAHKGHRVHRAMIEDWQTSEQYQLVTLIHVLEHVGDLRRFLGQVSRRVTAEGHLYIEVPFQVGPGLFLNRSVNVQHVNYFTPESLNFLLAEVGFSLRNLEFDRTGYAHNGMPGMIRALYVKQSGRINVATDGWRRTLRYLLDPTPMIRAVAKRS